MIEVLNLRICKDPYFVMLSRYGRFDEAELKIPNIMTFSTHGRPPENNLLCLREGFCRAAVETGRGPGEKTYSLGLFKQIVAAGTKNSREYLGTPFYWPLLTSSN
jgi:hypothetical protein